VVKLSANKRRTDRTRKKEVRHSGPEFLESGHGASDQEGESPVEMDSNKANTESENKSSEPKLILPADLEAERQASQHPQAEQGSQSKRAELKPEAGQKSGGKRVADNREGVYEGFAKMNESVFSLDGVKKAAAWYIETGEKLANQALELQERATSWARETPFAPLFEAQHSIARKFVERSASAARTLWQIQPS
jgi:hypothetical protein